MPPLADIAKIVIMAFVFVYLFNWLLTGLGLGQFTTDATGG